MKIQHRRPKVGFVVTRGHHYAFCRSIGGMFALFSDAIEPVIICSFADVTRIQEILPGRRLTFHPLPAQIVDIPDSITSGSFDILYYWEVATGGLNYFLPFCRLAPIQCTSWGIQITSGIPNVDYYLSSKWIEVETAQQQYSETLVVLDTMLSYQIRAPRPKKLREREYFSINADEHLYLCAQHLGKFHPDFDNTLAQILRADVHGVVLVTQGKFPWVQQKLRQRWESRIGDVANRIRFVPQQKGDEYYSLLIHADVLLDPTHFGGVNTTYDALSFGKPVVTLPTRFNRGRYTQGCYRLMGQSECIATDENDYVQKAIDIATDPDRRRALEAELDKSSQVLFRNEQAAAELESLFLQWADERR